MKAKEYLQQLYRLDVIINQKIQEKDDLLTFLTSISYPDISQERVQGGKLPGETGFSQRVIRLIDLEEEINTEIDYSVNLKHKIINEIHSLKNINHMEILYKRYVENKRLEKIAVEMNYTYQYIKEIHGHALQEFERTYPNLL